MDRNQRARDDFRRNEEIAKMRREFAAAVSKGDVKVLDRFANPLEPGSLVVWKTPEDFVWLVKDVKPVLDPRTQPGLVEMTLTVTVPVLFRVNDPIVPMIRVGKQAVKEGEQTKLEEPTVPVEETVDPTLGDA